MSERKLHHLKKNPKAVLLTARELRETANERVHLIAKEFTNGFNFLSKYPKSVTIFGGNHFLENDDYYVKARRLAGRIVNELNYAIVTGGGPGIMEAANRGAFEAGGESLGLTIELAHEQAPNEYLTESLDFFYFFSRKVCLSFSAEAYVFFPGGYGTMDEFFEIITLVQTEKIQKIPIILYGSEYWKHLHELIKNQIAERGLIYPEDVNLYKITDDESEIIQMIKDAPIRNGVQFTHKDALGLKSLGIHIQKTTE
jgi:uncharacterized protein (TIGR00730 family)